MADTPHPQHLAAYELAGFLLAHGLWYIADNAPVLPMGAYISPDRRGIVRFTDNLWEPAISQARRWFGSNRGKAEVAALLSDGRAWFSGGAQDALIVDIAVYGKGPAGSIALPYLQANGRFVVQRPAINPAPSLVEHAEALGTAFARGLRGHHSGNQVFERARAAVA
ncbi:MAG: hypothetical protein EP330_23505 [Deltaproteobacteria bacterium]|nr:MAG: hypothetical protein EP330_23505 [Deltaproteobacteria bacterium]